MKLEAQHTRTENRQDSDLLPLLPPYQGDKCDYFCPGGCVNVCRHRRLTIPQAYQACREMFAATGDMIAFNQMIAYMEYMPEYNPEPRR